MRHSIGAGLLFMALAAVAPPAAHAQDYKVVQRATLGGEGGWDLLTVDPAAQRLYVSRGTRVMVIDAGTLKLVGEIPGTAGVHGIAIASDLGRGFTSNGRTGSSTIFDLATLKPVGEVKTGENPDAILYEPKSHRVLAFNARSKDATVIDAKAGTVAGTIALEGQPELAVHDDKGTVFVNLEDKSEVLALDPVALKVKARWSLAPCEEPTGLAIDRAHRRLFAACANKMMAVMDADSGKVVTTVPIGQGPDGAAFDAERQLAFSPNGRDGTVTVIHESAPDKFEVVQTVVTSKSARTLDLDPKSHKLYLLAAQFGPPPSPTAEQPRPRPTMVPGTFEVLVVGR
jgi:DNA-binding beta-propeller fold protein YncE